MVLKEENGTTCIKESKFQAVARQRFFLRKPIAIFCVPASPEITINFRYRRIFSSVFSVFINKYTSSTNMFNEPH